MARPHLFHLATCCLVGLSLTGILHAEDNSDIVSPSTIPLPAGADIRIGTSLPLSGPNGDIGTDFLKGAQIYVEKINHAGGIYGRKLKLISYDDGYEPLTTISNTRTLLGPVDAFLLFNYLGTSTSRVAMPIATYQGVPYIGAFTGATFLRQPVVPTVFNIRASYADETEAMVAYLTRKLGLTRIGLLIQDDDYGSEGRNGVNKALEKRNLKVVAVGKYKRNTSDIKPALTKLQAANPQAIIIIGTYAPAAAFIKQAHTTGFHPVFMNMSIVGSQKLVENLGADSEGVYITQTMPPPQDTSLPLIKSYLADAASSTVPGLNTQSYSTLEGYTNANVLAHLLTATGPNLSRAALVSTSENLGHFTIGGLPFMYSPTNHQGLKLVYLTRIISGTVVPIPRDQF